MRDTLVLPADDQGAAADCDLMPNDITDLNPSWGWAAGAGITTAGDLIWYARALVKGAFLSPELQASRLGSPRPIGAAPYGLALAQFGPLIGHDGSLPGYRSFMGRDADTGTTLIAVANPTTSPAVNTTANEIARPSIGMLAGL